MASFYALYSSRNGRHSCRAGSVNHHLDGARADPNKLCFILHTGGIAGTTFLAVVKTNLQKLIRIFFLFPLLQLSLFCRARYFLCSDGKEAMLFLNKAQPGDTIALADGVYNDALIRFAAQGVAASPVVFMAQTGGQVFFEGRSTLSFSGSYIVVKGFCWRNGGTINEQSVIEFKTAADKPADYSIVEHCSIDNYNNADKTIDNKWISVYGKYNTVKNCLLRGKDNLGATLTVWLKDGEPAHHTVEYNHFLQRINGPAADNGLESMRIGDSKTSMTDAFCLVQLNLFEECDGEIEIISNKSGKNSFLNNTFYNSNGGLTLRHGNGAICDGNFFFGNNKPGSYGIRIIGENHTVSSNYFSGLNGSADKFRAPITVVNGVENSPPNGYLKEKKGLKTGKFIIN